MNTVDIRGETPWHRPRYAAALTNWRLHSSIVHARMAAPFRKQSPAVRAAFDHDGGRKHPGTQGDGGADVGGGSVPVSSLSAALFRWFSRGRRTDRAGAQKCLRSSAPDL